MIRLCERLTEKHEVLMSLADDNKMAINDYTQRGNVYEFILDSEVVGVAVSIMTRPNTLELVNLAVDPEQQGKGIGREMIRFIIETAKASNCHTVTVGTGNSGIGQLKLYQQEGFRMKSIDTDYFLKHYDEPIYENGIRCKDMVHLEKDLLR